MAKPISNLGVPEFCRLAFSLTDQQRGLIDKVLELTPKNRKDFMRNLLDAACSSVPVLGLFVGNREIVGMVENPFCLDGSGNPYAIQLMGYRQPDVVPYPDIMDFNTFVKTRNC